MLSRFDDYPIHQTSEPIRFPATTDRHAYDRYWYNGYSKDGDFYFGIGAALYPNLGIMDCGFSLVRDGVQHAFHASRRAPLEPSEIEIGPFRIDILEPMKAHCITLKENETGISCRLEWLARTANFAEGHQRSARGQAMHMEATRFNQFGRWQGEISYQGKDLAVHANEVYGTKDRSWGIRPVGDPAPPGAPPMSVPQVYFLWAPLHWENRCTHVGLFDNACGEPWHWDGMLMPTYASPEKIPGVEDPGAEPVAGMEYDVEYIAGTRRIQRAKFRLKERSGATQEIELDPMLCFRMKGIGYSHPEWGHGKWKGDLAMAGESWRCEDVDEHALENQHIQQVVRARSNGEQGIGVLEQILLGPHSPSGFKEFLDFAP